MASVLLLGLRVFANGGKEVRFQRAKRSHDGKLTVIHQCLNNLN
jgi:hypothetical protein